MMCTVLQVFPRVLFWASFIWYLFPLSHNFIICLFSRQVSSLCVQLKLESGFQLISKILITVRLKSWLLALNLFCQNLIVSLWLLIFFPPQLKSLGVILDSSLSFKVLHFYNINRLRSSLSMNSTEVLFRALVITQIDYYNALYSKLLYELQLVQNSAVHGLSRSPSVEHITPVLQQLHLLPYRSNVQI